MGMEKETDRETETRSDDNYQNLSLEELLIRTKKGIRDSVAAVVAMASAEEKKQELEKEDRKKEEVEAKEMTTAEDKKKNEKVKDVEGKDEDLIDEDSRWRVDRGL